MTKSEAYWLLTELMDKADSEYSEALLMAMDLLQSEDLLSETPIADVAEVKHGKWIDNKIPNSILCKCSECGFSCGAYTFNYCPNCGAKMDGKEDA